MSDKPVIEPLLPAGMPAPFANYSHGVKVSAGADMVFCSGQLGIDAEGNIPDTAEEQTELCFANIAKILAASGMALKDVIRVNAYVNDRIHAAAYMKVRDKLFPQPAPASTLLVISGFTRDKFVVEVEAVAARRPD